ncbi:MAG: hypothetical protein ACOH19_16445 [Rhodoglobus sp.]
MTLPGEMEHVPTKVVPFYVTGYDEVDVPAEPEEPAEAPEPVEERVARSSILGQIALCFALATAAAHVIAVVLAASGSFVAGTVFAWIAVWVSAATILGSLVAIVGRFGRGWAIAALILGLFANPLLLLNVLNFLGGS